MTGSVVHSPISSTIRRGRTIILILQFQSKADKVHGMSDEQDLIQNVHEYSDQAEKLIHETLRRFDSLLNEGDISLLPQRAVDFIYASFQNKQQFLRARNLLNELDPDSASDFGVLLQSQRSRADALSDAAQGRYHLVKALLLKQATSLNLNLASGAARYPSVQQQNLMKLETLIPKIPFQGPPIQPTPIPSLP